MKENIIGLAAFIGILIILGGSLYLVQRAWSLGEKPEDYKIICLGGHQYWRANFMNKGLLGINLNDSGKPILCEIK